MKIALDPGAYTPIRAHADDAGLDLRTPVEVVLHPRSSAIIDTGVHVELPPNTVGMLKSKSGLNTLHGIVSEGVIDVGFSGAIKVKLYNHSDERYIFHAGDKITQLVVLPLHSVGDIEIVDSVTPGERGNNGYGSSGK